MPGRKPTSTKQRKAELQLKRAIKRGDAPPEAATNSTNRRRRGRGRGGNSSNSQQPRDPNVEASRRLESSFVKFSPTFLEEAKRKASSLIIPRPIPCANLIFPSQSIRPKTSTDAPHLSVLKRPKWNYEMSKKEVENNEAALFRRWLEDTDRAVKTATITSTAGGDTGVGTSSVDHSDPVSEPGTDDATTSPDAEPDPEANSKAEEDGMPAASPLYERNLEVYRQL
jgi:hypothetical protein